MRAGDHAILIVGYSKDHIIYHDPLLKRGYYQSMKISEFFNLHNSNVLGYCIESSKKPTDLKSLRIRKARTNSKYAKYFSAQSRALDNPEFNDLKDRIIKAISACRALNGFEASITQCTQLEEIKNIIKQKLSSENKGKDCLTTILFYLGALDNNDHEQARKAYYFDGIHFIIAAILLNSVAATLNYCKVLVANTYFWLTIIFFNLLFISFFAHAQHIGRKVDYYPAPNPDNTKQIYAASSDISVNETTGSISIA